MWTRIKRAWQVLTSKVVVMSEGEGSFICGPSEECCIATIGIVSRLLEIVDSNERAALVETLKVIGLPPEEKVKILKEQKKKNIDLAMKTVKELMKKIK